MQTRTLGGEGGRRGFFGGSHSKPRTVGLIVVGVVGSLLTILLQTVGLLLAVAAAGVVFLATMRTHRGSVLVRVQARRRWTQRRKSGTVRFRPVATRPDDLDPSVGTRAERKAAAAEWASYRDWPDGAEGMHWLQRGRGQAGIAWHTPTGEEAYLSVAFSVAGQIAGVESDTFLTTAMLAYGSLLARYGASSALPSRVQSVTRVVPVDSAFHEAWVWQQLDDDAPVDLVASYDEVVRLASAGGLMQRHYMVVRWPVTPAFLAAAKRRGPGLAGWRSLMAAEITAVRSHLATARLGGVRAVSAAQLAAVLRHMQHPSWPIDQAADVDIDAPWLPSVDELSATVTTAEGPEGEVETWWHRTAELPIGEFETGPRTSLWVAPLLSRLPHPIIRTVSLQTEVVPAAEARAAARTDVTTDIADLEAQKEKGVLTSDELEAGLAAARGRLGDLSPGSGHHGAGWVGHVTITARSREELVDATAKITEAANDAGITALAWLDTYQAAASACTWPLARGMRPIGRSNATVLRQVLAGSGSKESI